MKTRIKKIESRKFNLLIAPYASLIRVGNAVIEIGRGSFSVVSQMTLYRPEILEVPTLVASIGSYCEFNPSCNLVIGGEHLVGERFINTFSDSFQIRELISEKSLIAPQSKGAIQIGNNVVLSAGAVVLSGSSIGNNVLVAAGALINGNFESNQVIGGVPAKKIKEIVAPKIEWWNLSEQCIPDYIQNKTVDNPTPNKTRHLRLVFDGIQNKEGKVGKMDLVGLHIKEQFIPISELAKHHLSYFSDSNNDDPYMTVSDEVFDDLL